MIFVLQRFCELLDRDPLLAVGVYDLKERCNELFAEHTCQVS
jgi:hypothetical protein